MKWFRAYHEMLEDEKVGTLTDAQYRTWIEILCLACRAESGGDTKMTVSEAEWKLRRNVSEFIPELLHRGLVTFLKGENGRETIFVPKWDKRQYLSDNSTIRVNKHRGKQA